MAQELKANTTISHYRVVSKIGAGGMGEVYKAHDSRLDREVAIKVLPLELSADEDRLRRFEQEAKATSALNHPNILTVYDIGEHDGTPFIVSELLEGEELRQRLDEGPIPLRKVTEYAGQIVSGLTAAHEKGITHRDLKPENLFITKDDRVKILDFGLAKLSEPGAVATGSEDHTRKALTNPGVVMGTVGYMSPEQVRGHKIDHRSDIFSFGLILYEMITGRRAFQEESLAETMSAIVKEEPPEMLESNPNISPSLERIVRRCLEKKPERRFQSTADLGFALESLSAPTSSSGANVTTAVSVISPEIDRSPWLNRLLGAAGGALLITLASLPFILGYFRTASTVQAGPIRFSIPAPEKATQLLTPAISPDGRMLIFTALIDGKGELWQRSMDSATIQPVPGVTGLQGMQVWSPDSRSIAFPAEGKLKRLDMSGGAPRVLCSLPPKASTGEGASAWSQDGVILFTAHAAIYRVSANGGDAEVVLGSEKPDSDVQYQWPFFLPDGRHFLFLRTGKQQAAAEIHIGSLDNKETTRLVTADSHAIYTATRSGGQLLYARGNSLVAQAFDPVALKLAGEPSVISETVSVTPTHRGIFGASGSGLIIFYSGSLGGGQQLAWVDRAGKTIGTIASSGNFKSPAISPDGQRVSVTRSDASLATSDIYVIDLARGTNSRFTFSDGNDQNSNWSTDGSRISWTSGRGGSYQIFRKAASGAGDDELLGSTDLSLSDTKWSPDGKSILFDRFAGATGQDLWILPLNGGSKPYAYLQGPFNERLGAFSPDGHWIAYTSDESGRPEVFLQSFPVSATKIQISTNGGTSAAWRGDGKELFYVSADNKLTSVEIKANGAGVGVPAPMFDLGLLRRTHTYTPASDGQRFLFVTELQQSGSMQYDVIANWSGDAKK